MISSDNNSKIYKRKLQFQERRYFCTPNSVNYLVIRIKGNISKKLLKKAIAKAQIRHKLLQAKLLIDKNNDVWLTTNNVEDITLEIKERKYENQWIQKCLEENFIQFDYYNHPLIKFFLLYSKEVSDLIIKADHVFADGLALSYLTRDIFEYIKDPSKKVEKLPIPPTVNLDIIPSDVSENYFVIKFIEWINKRWDKNKLKLNIEDYRQLFNAYWKKYPTKHLQINFTKKETSQLIDLCNKSGISVNTGLIASIVRSQSIVKKTNKQKKGGIAISTRNHLKVDIDNFYGFFATSMFLGLKNKPNKSFLDLAKIYHKKINSKIKKKTFLVNLLRFNLLDPSINDGIIVKMFGDIVTKKYQHFSKLYSYSKKKDFVSLILNWAVNKHFDFGLTNLGSIDLNEKYGKLRIDRVFYLSHITPYTDIVFSAVTASDKLSIGISYLENNVNTEDILKIKNLFYKLLKGENPL